MMSAGMHQNTLRREVAAPRISNPRAAGTRVNGLTHIINSNAASRL